MYLFAQVIHCIFPLIAFILLIIGIKQNAIYYTISSLWLSLIALILHYQASGGEILGSYFNYIHAGIYTLNLIVLFLALTRVMTHLSNDTPAFKYLSKLIQVLVVIGGFLVIINLWINAYFLDNRMSGIPIMQVALVQKPDYCHYRYIFYKVGSDGSVTYLCPNYYGLIPSIGHLDMSTDFIATQLSAPNKERLLQLQRKS